MPKTIDLTEQRFGRFMVMHQVGKDKQGNSLWKCVCECGNEKIIRGYDLRRGGTKSCGCLRMENNSLMAPNDYLTEGEMTRIVLKRIDGAILYAIIDTEDIDKVRPFHWCAWRNRKYPNDFYAQSDSFNRHKPIKLHRLIADCPDGYVVDHINHITLDNRKSNLKITTSSENQQNRLGAQNNSSSGIRGVCWSKAHNKWRSYLRLNGKQVHLGFFDRIEDAEREVKKARERHFTNLNPNHH